MLLRVHIGRSQICLAGAVIPSQEIVFDSSHYSIISYNFSSNNWDTRTMCNRKHERGGNLEPGGKEKEPPCQSRDRSSMPSPGIARKLISSLSPTVSCHLWVGLAQSSAHASGPFLSWASILLGWWPASGASANTALSSKDS